MCANSLIECGTASHPSENTYTPFSPQTELNMAQPSDTGTPHFSPWKALLDYTPQTKALHIKSITTAQLQSGDYAILSMFEYK